MRHGRVFEDVEIMRQGQRVYVEALRLLQDALYDQALMWSDETLASVRALVLYEFFESSADNPAAWYRHLDRITTLMESRGPQRTSSAIARSVLEDIRYALMLKALMVRKRSLFGREDWIMMHWNQRIKPTEQQVYDQGFRLAAILETAEGLIEPRTDNHTLDETADLLRACNILHQQMVNLFQQKFKPFLQQRWSDWSRPQLHETPESTSLDPADINQLTLVINLWSCMLVMAWVADVLRSRLMDAVDARLIDAQKVAGIKDLCNACVTYTVEFALYDLGLAILQYFPLCVSSGVRNIAVNRMLFPLTCILWQFRHSEKHFQEATALMRQISEARTVRVAAPGYSVVALIPAIAHGDFGLLAS